MDFAIRSRLHVHDIVGSKKLIQPQTEQITEVPVAHIARSLAEVEMQVALAKQLDC